MSSYLSVLKKRNRRRAVFLIKITVYNIISSYLSNAFVGILKKISTFPKCMYNVKKTTTKCPQYIYSLEQTAHTSSLPSTYGGHFKEPHRASTE